MRCHSQFGSIARVLSAGALPLSAAQPVLRARSSRPRDDDRPLGPQIPSNWEGLADRFGNGSAETLKRLYGPQLRECARRLGRARQAIGHFVYVPRGHRISEGEKIRALLSEAAVHGRLMRDFLPVLQEQNPDLPTLQLLTDYELEATAPYRRGTELEDFRIGVMRPRRIFEQLVRVEVKVCRYYERVAERAGQQDDHRIEAYWRRGGGFFYPQGSQTEYEVRRLRRLDPDRWLFTTDERVPEEGQEYRGMRIYPIGVSLSQFDEWSCDMAVEMMRSGLNPLLGQPREIADIILGHLAHEPGGLELFFLGDRKLAMSHLTAALGPNLARRQISIYHPHGESDHIRILQGHLWKNQSNDF